MTPSGPELPALRVSDAEREAVVSVLRRATGEGRLTYDELTERIALADAARTDADLARLTADLPATDAPPAPPAADGERMDWVIAVMGGAKRKGRWRARVRTTAVSLMGGCQLDLREAELPAGGMMITAVTIMGGVEVTVPAGVRVEMSGLALMGGNRDRSGSEACPPGAPIVRVRAYSLMGGVNVRRKKRRLGHGGHEPGALTPPTPPAAQRPPH